MMPNIGFIHLTKFLNEWIEIKNYDYRGDAGLQLSINSTSDEARREMFSGNSLVLADISAVAKDLGVPKGRKITLNFALTNAPVDAEILLKLFNPKYFLIKITPMHITKSCQTNSLLTSNGYEYYYPYKEVEESLKKVGFDVIVFIPSKEEDESRITCGNAILSDYSKI
jgi:23S rRNA (adenine2503-C2)-methyltransferase